ncbi:hypothetical protein GCM10020370_07130 [Paenibacillus hodogayensis]
MDRYEFRVRVTGVLIPRTFIRPVRCEPSRIAKEAALPEKKQPRTFDNRSARNSNGYRFTGCCSGTV